LRFFCDVVDIYLEVVPYLLFEVELHKPLVCSPHILQSEWHFHIAKATERSDKHGGGLVYLGKGIW
jgi:hypothetical protein